MSVVTIVRTDWIDEVPDVAPGTPIDNAAKQELYDQIDAALAQVTDLIDGIDPGDGGPGGGGTVTHTAGALTAGHVVVGNGAADVVALASLGTAVTVLHGNAAGPPSFGPVSLATDVSGTLLAAQEPAHTGDVTNAAGSLALAIGAGKVTNAMLAGAIAASKLVGSDLSLAESQVVNLVTDLAALAAAIAAAPSFADLALKAPLASPALTGTPTAPTASAATNTTQLATTAFVQAALAALIASAPGTLDTLNELAAALGNDPAFATTVATSIGLKAPLASPTLTGTPVAPTAAPGTNTTQLATTAFDTAAVAVETAARVAADALLAPIASPTFTGTPAAPTPTLGDSTTKIATTAFVFANAVSPYLFPATFVDSANVNALDDYEEGTWTPTFAGTTTAGVQTYGSRGGVYTKIGRLVFISFYCAMTAKDGATSGAQIQIKGLPFAVSGALPYPGGAFGNPAVYFAGLGTHSNGLFLQLQGGTAFYIADLGTGVLLTPTDLTATSTISGCMCYST